MMECPRCGFQQPTDQFCAKCGVNVETYVKKPKPFIVRLLQNPNFHLSLIGILIVFVVGWIFYSQANYVKLEIGRLVGTPISSRDAADPNEVAAQARMRDEAREAKEAADAENAAERAKPDVMAFEQDGAAVVAASSENSAGEKTTAGAGAPAAGSKIEISSWEIPREILIPLVQQAQQIGGGSGGRAFFFSNNAKLKEVLNSGAQSLAAVKTLSVSPNGQLTVETPPNAPEMFQFGLLVQLTKAEAKDVAIRFDTSLILPQNEAPGAVQPVVRRVAESSLNGSTPLAPTNAVAIVLDPPNRRPSEEIVSKAGDGPWSIFSSPEFRNGLTDWVIVVELK